jgi:ketosteroid isomerase-like protein
VSTSSFEIVQRFFEARSRGDLRYLDLVDENAEFDLSESRSPYQGIYRGHAQIRKQWETLQDAWGVADLRPEEPVVSGDHVVVTVRISARGRTSGVQLEGHGANVLTLKDGKIVRLKLFQTRAEALASVGL